MTGCTKCLKDCDIHADPNQPHYDLGHIGSPKSYKCDPDESQGYAPTSSKGKTSATTHGSASSKLAFDSPVGAPNHASVWEICAKSESKFLLHGWMYDGDDPYVICYYCGQRRSSTTGEVIEAAHMLDEGFTKKQKFKWVEAYPTLSGVHDVYEADHRAIAEGFARLCSDAHIGKIIRSNLETKS